MRYINFDKIKLEQIIDKEILQNFQDKFAENFGISCITLDVDANPLTKVSNSTYFCQNFMRKNKEGNSRCIKCDLSGIKKSIDTGRPVIYDCHAGLTDFAVPIIVFGKYVGGIYGGQITTKRLDIKKFIELGKELEINDLNYIESVKEIKVLKKEKLNLAANVLDIVVNNMAELGMKKFLFENIFLELKNRVERAGIISKELMRFSNEVEDEQIILNKKIEQINEFSKEITQTSEFIKNIAKQTKILGINAVIEASRSNQIKNGFDVIAREIQALSNKSEKSVEGIVKSNWQVQSNIENTKENSKKILELKDKQTLLIHEITSQLSEALQLTTNINEIDK